MFVGITQSLKGDIINNIRQMRHKEELAVGMAVKPDVSIADLDERVWGKHLHLKNEMPDSWKPKYKNVNITLHYQGREYNDIFTLSMEHEDVPSVKDGYYRHDPKIKFKKDEVLPQELAEWAEKQRVLTDVAERWNKVEEQLIAFLDKCRSLNEALKLWPQVAMYIPKQYINKVEEKRETQKRGVSEAAEALKEVDTEHLTAAVVIARMSDDKQQ